MIDATRLTPLDRLRLLEQLGENVEWLQTMREYEELLRDAALYADGAVERESARQQFHAVRGLRAYVEARMAGYRRDHEQEVIAAGDS